MSKRIFEELPARKHAPAVAAPAAKAKGGPEAKGGEKKGGEGEGSEKRIRQAVYDIRYRARREDIDLKQAFSQYMSNSSLSQAERTAVREKLFGKAGGVSEQHGFESIDWAVDGVANALYKVFVEGVEKQEPQLELVYERQMEGKEGTKYQVRVLDPKSGRSYVRMANREKITQLRAKGLKVEMTDAGEPYEGRKKEVPNKGGLDKPVHPSKRDGDVNDDGKKDKTDSYIYNRRDKINKAMATRKEDFLWSEANGATGTTSTEGQNKNKITGAGVDNSSRITVFPQDGSDTIKAGTELEGPFLAEKAKSKAQQRFMGMVYATKKGKKAPSPEVAAAAEGMSKKKAKKFAKTKHKGLPEKKSMSEAVTGGSAPQVPASVAQFVDEFPQRAQQILKNLKNIQGGSSAAKPAKKKVTEEASCPKCGKSPCECDTRANKTYRDLLKNKLRATGKNVLAACGDEENLEKVYNDMMTASFIKTNRETGKLEPVHVFKESDNLPVTAYTKGERHSGKAGAMSGEEVRIANKGVSGRVRENIKGV